MRTEVAIVGVVLAVVGAALWYLPLTAATSTKEVPLGDAYDFGVPSTLIVGSIPYSAAWTGTGATNVTVFACGSDAGCVNATSHTIVAHGAGTTGSVGWTGKSGQYYLLVPNATVNLTLTYHEPVAGGLAGLGLLGAGILIAVAGLAIRKDKPSAPAEPKRP